MQDAIVVNRLCFLSLVADISPPPSQLVFSVDGITTCTTIQTQNDAVYEDNEQFMLSLIPTNPSISIGVGLTTVEITDNDGKCFL